MATETLPSWEFPLISMGSKLFKAGMQAQWLHDPCLLGGTRGSTQGGKSHMATSRHFSGGGGDYSPHNG